MTFLATVALQRLRDDSATHDVNGADPGPLIAPLVEAGLFVSVLPSPWGSSVGTDPKMTLLLHDLLTGVGGANLSAGRLFEGHVNAVKLVCRFGSADQTAEMAKAVSAGALMGVWNAETPPGVRLEATSGQLSLKGSKIYASGAGLVDRPLITAKDQDGQIVMTTPKAAVHAPFDLSGWRMRGMRATATGTVHLDDVPVAQSEVIGQPDDYYRSPGFRGGAWRFAAVQLGAVEEIARLMAIGMKARGRANDPHQKTRMGDAEIAVQTARLWTRHAAEVVEGGRCSAEEADATAGMARLVVERAGIEVIALAERSLGLMAFTEAEPIERIVRDLSTYLRQPFPDAVLEGIGEWTLQR